MVNPVRTRTGPEPEGCGGGGKCLVLVGRGPAPAPPSRSLISPALSLESPPHERHILECHHPSNVAASQMSLPLERRRHPQMLPLRPQMAPPSQTSPNVADPSNIAAPHWASDVAAPAPPPQMLLLLNPGTISDNFILQHILQPRRPIHEHRHQEDVVCTNTLWLFRSTSSRRHPRKSGFTLPRRTQLERHPCQPASDSVIVTVACLYCAHVFTPPCLASAKQAIEPHFASIFSACARLLDTANGVVSLAPLVVLVVMYY